MKKLQGIIVICIIVLFAFRQIEAGSIRGRVVPAEGALHVFAIAGKDTVSGAITLGEFQLNNIKPGSYTVIIDAHAPYKDVVREGILVSDGNVVDLGEIQLPQ